jgi:hypothetical protein
MRGIEGRRMHADADDSPTLQADGCEFLALAKRSGFAAAHCDALSRELPAAVDALWRRRAWEIPEGHIDDYVKLRWMNWSSGALVLTPAGRAVHDTAVARGLWHEER